MPSPAIETRDLGKRYRLGQIGASTLRDELQRLFAGRPEGAEDAGKTGPEYLWALRGISVEVERGEVLGIIGRNGSGKSTLLKILSRITEPTEGEAVLRGRVASLLEVGTGFHPELTGRENVFLNGVILGMKRREIATHFDQIVDFADMGKHIDTPVKRYSSGQRVRLAFAVAAHLQAEILIIDEVLAVGDHSFQKKCLGKMHDVASGEGRTVLFVSHNMNAVVSLCQRVLHLDSGTCQAIGEPDETVRDYLAGMAKSGGSMDLRSHPLAKGSGQERIFRSVSLNGKPLAEAVVGVGEEAVFDIEICVRQKIDVVLGLCDETGGRVVIFHSLVHSGLVIRGDGEMTLRCRVPELALMPGSYSVDLSAVAGYQVVEKLETVGAFSVSFQDWFGTGQLPSAKSARVLFRCEWEKR